MAFGFHSLRGHPKFTILVCLRILSLFLLVFLLFQPVIHWKTQSHIPLKWNVYLDNSVSMRYHQSLSLQSIKNGVEFVENEIRMKETSYSLFQFSRELNEVRNFSLNADGSATDLGIVLDHILSEQDTLAGSIIITDGQLTQGKHPNSFGVIESPIHIIAVGDSIPMVDIAIKSIDAPTVAIKGESIKADVIVQAAGKLKKPVNVSLYQGLKLLGSKRVQIQGGGSEKAISFQFRSKQIGTWKYLAKVSSTSEEINIENNQQLFEINILKDRYPVALITGSPNYHTSLIKKYIKSYPRIKLDHYVQKSEQIFYPSLDNFWKSSYDLIILDNFPSTPIPKSLQRVFGKKVIKEQSSLAWAFGPNMSKNTAESIFPFFHIKGHKLTTKTDPSEWSFTDDVNVDSFIQLSANTSSVFPPLRLLDFSITPTKQEVEILATLDNEKTYPIFIRSEINGLRSFIFGASDMYKLHYSMNELENSNFLEKYWHSVFNWLLKSGAENELYFRLNKKSFQQGEEIHITGTQKGIDDPASARAFITVIKDGKNVNSAELHFNLSHSRWEGNIWASSPGDYSYEIGVEHGNITSIHRGEFIVKESQIELNRVFVNRLLLKKLAKNSGGKYIPWASRADVSKLDMNQSKNITNRANIKFSQNPWVVVLLLLLLCFEWTIRRFSGLP